MALLLFLLTLLTTTVVGSRLQYNFNRGAPAYAGNDDLFPFPWIWHHPALLALGLPFSLTLLSILLAHELGHYFACCHYRLDSTCPMFLPAPTLIGTMGAFIRIKAPFGDPWELFDVGVAGPLAGIALTLPALLYGLALSHPVPAPQAAVWRQQWLAFGWPPLAQWLAAWLHPGVAPQALALSPVARAGFLGLLVTMLNLIPGAQLDGGHILYAVSPRAHRIASWASLAALAAAGWLWWPGWYVFAIFIAAMRVRHPYVPPAPRLGPGRIALALVALAIFVLCFTPAPLLTPY